MTPRRRFTVLDALVMVAALAGSMALFRLELARRWDSIADPPSMDGSFLSKKLFQIQVASAVCRPCLLPPTIAALVLRLRLPRPRFRRLVAQPGFVACLVITLTTLVGGIFVLLTLAIGGSGWWIAMSDLLWGWSGQTVVGAWMLQALSRRWKSEASWIDRAGRFLGVCWILAFLIPMVASPWLYDSSPPVPVTNSSLAPLPPAPPFVLPELPEPPLTIPEPPPTESRPTSPLQTTPSG